MKIIKTLTLAALAVTLLFQTPLTLAGDNGNKGNGDKGDDNDRGNRDHRDARATFTKWVTAFPNQPGRIIDMAGVVGGAVGDGTFTGEVLLYSPGATATDVSHFVAFYHFTGPKHSFTALVNVVQTGSGVGTKAVITGVVTEGWLEGHAVKGEYTEGTCGTPLMPCYTGFLKIDRDSKD